MEGKKKMLKDAILLCSSCGMEALYVKRQLVEQGKPIKDKANKLSKLQYLFYLSDKYNFNLREMKEYKLPKLDQEDFDNTQRFYPNLDDYYGE